MGRRCACKPVACHRSGHCTGQSGVEARAQIYRQPEQEGQFHRVVVGSDSGRSCQLYIISIVLRGDLLGI